MSVVTNVLLSDDSLRNDQVWEAVVSRLNLVLLNNQDVGGDKCLENMLYIGAFNYLRLEEFIATLRDIYKHVELDDDVQLLVKEQDECRWKEVEWMKER